MSRVVLGRRAAPSGRAAILGLLAVVTLFAVLTALASPATAADVDATGIQLDTAGAGTAVGLWVSRLLNHLALAATVGFLLLPAWLLSGRIGTGGGSPSEGRTPVEAVAPSGGSAPAEAPLTVPGTSRTRVSGAVGTASPPVPTSRLSMRWGTRAAAFGAGLWALGALGVFLFGLSNAAARPLPEVIGGDVLSRFATTRFGTAILLQLALAVVVGVLAGTARGRSGARLALGVALAGAFGPAWWGHAATAQPTLLAVVSDWLHIAGASVWVGGLLALTAVVLFPRSDVAPYGPTVRFSGLAGWAIVVVGVTGVINTLLHTTAPAQLVETTWGRLSLAKALLLLGLAGFGWAHRRRVIPRLRGSSADPGSRSAFVRLAGVELLVMLVAVGIATSMASGLPAGVEAAVRIQTFTVPLGDGMAEVSLDPATTGRNELHLYVYDDGAALRSVDAASMLLRAGDLTVRPRLVRSGPGHFTGFVDVPRGGAWDVSVRIEAGGEVEEARSSLTVR